MAGEFDPGYKNQLSIYEKETLQKIEEFRRSRSNFGTQKNINQTIYTNVKKGLDDSNIYKGRCLCLRRLRLKTTYLLDHFKDLKPLRYYTLKKKLPDYRTSKAQIDPTEPADKEEKNLNEICSSRQLWTKEALDKFFQDSYKIKGENEPSRKKKEFKKKSPSGPCGTVLRKLKAGKLSEGIIESCRCEDGREVTVVIKGICLCNKGTLNNVDLNKVCDEYSKMANRKSAVDMPHMMNPSKTPEKPLRLDSEEENEQEKENIEEENNEINKPETVLGNQEVNIKTEKKPEVDIQTEVKNLDEVKLPSIVDSLEVLKNQRKLATTVMDINEKVTDNVDVPTKRVKKITFKSSDLKPEKTEKKKVSNASDITLFPKSLSKDTISGGSQESDTSEYKVSDSLRNLLINDEDDKNVENKPKARVKNKSRRTELKKHSERESESARPGVTIREGALVREHPSVIHTQNISREINEKKSEVDMPGSKSKINDTLTQEKQTAVPEINAGADNSSMISLYRNKSEEKSSLALTKEMIEKHSILISKLKPGKDISKQEDSHIPSQTD